MFHFTGQLDAYSEKQFISYVGDVLKTNASPAVFDLSKIDFLDSCLFYTSPSPRD